VYGGAQIKYCVKDGAPYQLALYCAVLYCTVLYCAVLSCPVLSCTVLYCTEMYCTILYPPQGPCRPFCPHVSLALPFQRRGGIFFSVTFLFVLVAGLNTLEFTLTSELPRF